MTKHQVAEELVRTEERYQLVIELLVFGGHVTKQQVNQAIEIVAKLKNSKPSRKSTGAAKKVSVKPKLIRAGVL